MRTHVFLQKGTWLKCALHAHTTNSDGELAPADLVRHYEEAGFDALVITDHWIRTRIDDPKVERTRFDVEPFFPEMVSKLPPGDQAFYTARAISLRTHVVNAEAKKSMWPQAEGKFREALAAKKGRPGEDHLDGGQQQGQAHGRMETKRTFRRKTG